MTKFSLIAAGAVAAAAFGLTAAVCAGDETTRPAGSAGGDAQASKAVQVDAALPAYEKVDEKLEGTLNAIGSDTMNNIMAGWAEAFQRLYPKVKVQIEGKGSSTAPPALLEGTAQLGPMSRDMKEAEVSGFETRHGYKPTRLRTALDALGVFVNKDNPVSSLTMQQVDSIFSSTRKAGGDEIKTWGDLGLSGEWGAAPITLYGRNAASGTYVYFKENALKKGDFKDAVKEQPGSAGVVQGVTEDKFGIGYSGIGYRTAGIKLVGLQVKEDGTVYQPTLGNVLAGAYPLGRFLNVYVNKSPNEPLSPEVREFCRFMFSKEGQEVVAKDGFMPLPEKIAAQERARIQ